jgi:hypothetical protein
MEAIGALFVAVLWVASVVVPLFIIYHFYLLLKRQVIAKEREARALEKLASNLGDIAIPRSATESGN